MRDGNRERERERGREREKERKREGERKTDREREKPVTDDAALNHAANLLGAWERRFASLDVCFDNYKMKA